MATRAKVIVAVAAALAFTAAAAMAQVKSKSAGVVGDVTCNAVTSAGVTVVPHRANRQSLAIINNSGSSVRLAFNKCSTCTISSSDGFELPTSFAFYDSYPSIFVGRISCAGISTSSPTIRVSELLQ